jgi:hypothetical protein
VHKARRKQFFFEKKNQKTFVRYGQRRLSRLLWRRRPTDKSFLVLFFKKELLPCRPLLKMRGI